MEIAYFTLHGDIGREEIDIAHGKPEVCSKVRKPLSWDIQTKGRRAAAEVETGRWVV